MKKFITHLGLLVSTLFATIFLGLSAVNAQSNPRIGPVVTVNPASRTACIPTSGTSSVTYTVQGTRAQSGPVNGTYSVSGLPAGVTGSFSPATLNSNGNNAFPSSTLTLTMTSTATPGSTLFTVRLADGGGSGTGAGTLILNKAPSFTTCPTNITTSTTTGACSAPVTYTATASGTPAPTYSYEFTGATTGSGTGTGSGSTFNKGTTNVIVRATNSCGEATCSFTVTVTDNTAPTITACAPARSANANTNCQAAVPDFTGNVTATDNCTAAGSLVVTQSPAAGTLVGAGPTTVTLTVTDEDDNASTCTTTFTVTDNTAPTITACAPAQTGNANANCQAAVPDFRGNVTATDNCTAAGSLVVTQSPAAGTLVGTGPTTVTLTVRDAAGNPTTCTTTFTVTDNQPPVINCPAPVTFSCASAVPAAATNYAAFVAAGGTATDNCSGTITITHVSDVTSNQTCPNRYTVTRTYRATDAAGNSSTNCTQTITVNDQIGPVVQNCPANITVAPTTLDGTVVNYTPPTATDNCGGNPSRVQTAGKPSGSRFPIGTTTNTYEFTDACGNKSYCTFTVTVTKPETCGNNQRDKKYYVCHNGNTICVSENAVPDHLAHGDYLGRCTNNRVAQREDIQVTAPLANKADLKSFQVVFGSNPSNSDFRLKVESSSNEPINIRVIDALGRLMTVMNGVKKNSPVIFGENYRKGYYFVEVIQGTNRKTVKLIKVN